jgi:hypothetical protein
LADNVAVPMHWSWKIPATAVTALPERLIDVLLF